MNFVRVALSAVRADLVAAFPELSIEIRGKED